ncbi:hypothetical protein [Terricaulis silvestris]|uniref:Uncharacterized protein n=1 Tax=Terricaulis silvestris TaxID=2686094 RepID=A0A6I6MNJ2_9CAUL|nr:hypothetical protein [Terricaulis silvestris]QGZ94337.1 hypothetical protein DSM104635_01155 [Terricaulis silvestris]
MSKRQIRLLVFTALYPAALAMIAWVALIGIGAMQVYFSGGIPTAIAALRSWPIIAIIAVPAYLGMIWWLLRAWRE